MLEQIQEFKAAFGNYVEDDRDDRLMMLSSLIVNTTPGQLVEMLESTDMAAMLTCVAYVDSKSPTARMARRSVEEGTTLDVEVLRKVIVTDGDKPEVARVLNAIAEEVGGDDYLQIIVVCLAAGHSIPGLRVNLWKP